MVVEIGNIIIDKIKNLPFIDKYAGVVKIVKIQDPSSGANKTKSFPVSCNMSLEQCTKGNRYLDLCPDSNKKSVLYLEDSGLRPVKKVGSKITFRASYDLICWLNLPKLGIDSCSYSSLAIAAIMASFPDLPFNEANMYQLISINVDGQKPTNTDPFARFYKEEIMQYLLYPFDHFVLPIDVEFTIDKRCIQINDLNPQIACVQK